MAQHDRSPCVRCVEGACPGTPDRDLRGSAHGSRGWLSRAARDRPRRGARLTRPVSGESRGGDRGHDCRPAGCGGERGRPAAGPVDGRAQRDGVAACARRESRAHRAAASLRDPPPRAAFGCRLGAARDEGRPGDGGAHSGGLRATRARDACDRRRGAVHHDGRVYCRRSVRAPAGASVVGGRRPHLPAGSRWLDAETRRTPRCWSSDKSLDP